MIRVTENLAQIRGKIDRYAANANRDGGAIRLLAVGKRHPAEKLRALAAAGQLDFGENYLNEAIEKQAQLTDLELCWHFIGAIQSNKTRQIATHFDWVHTVDRLKIASRLSEQRSVHRAPLNVCLQVNIDQEPSKSGLSPPEVSALAQAVLDMPGLRLRGLMAIPAPRNCKKEQREPVRRMQALMQKLRSQGIDVDTLSMGMSDDLEAAITEGANLVRIGTALFGPRP